jgi:hypothetical protein
LLTNKSRNDPIYFTSILIYLSYSGIDSISCFNSIKAYSFSGEISSLLITSSYTPVVRSILAEQTSLIFSKIARKISSALLIKICFVSTESISKKLVFF